MDGTAGSRIRLQVSAALWTLVNETAVEALPRCPALFWLIVTLLHSAQFEEYLRGVKLLALYLKKVDLSQPDVTRSLLEARPQGDYGAALPGLVPLLLKGLCSLEQEQSSMQLLSSLLTCPHSAILDVEADHGRLDLLFTLGLVPFLLTSLDAHAVCLLASSLSATFQQAPEELAQCFQQISQRKLSMQEREAFVEQLAATLVSLYFPRYELYTFTWLLSLLQNGPEVYHKAVLMLLRALARATCWEDSPLRQAPETLLFIPLLPHAQHNGPVGTDVLHALLASPGRLPPESAWADPHLSPAIEEHSTLFVYPWNSTNVDSLAPYRSTLRCLAQQESNPENKKSKTKPPKTRPRSRSHRPLPSSRLPVLVLPADPPPSHEWKAGRSPRGEPPKPPPRTPRSPIHST